ncbi:hypothetical protein BU14_0096s0023 [Porphyra umbilicalis]|uniref:Uncharacterized protein n=1 Tax=Porphyra umbilicalis TaxID=2786 RepID=A0A1X6PDB0_PORUM|nr:hypothetical protein BU14_0096s0023 [Porphyra umbilicalis]|eukprot:OSX78868.1 hypothetical protein BU14_0096s0023 [Porphyra umbilicalis]
MRRAASGGSARTVCHSPHRLQVKACACTRFVPLLSPPAVCRPPVSCCVVVAPPRSGCPARPPPSGSATGRGLGMAGPAAVCLHAQDARGAARRNGQRPGRCFGRPCRPGRSVDVQPPSPTSVGLLSLPPPSARPTRAAAQQRSSPLSVSCADSAGIAGGVGVGPRRRRARTDDRRHAPPVGVRGSAARHGRNCHGRHRQYVGRQCGPPGHVWSRGGRRGRRPSRGGRRGGAGPGGRGRRCGSRHGRHGGV